MRLEVKRTRKTGEEITHLCGDRGDGREWRVDKLTAALEIAAAEQKRQPSPYFVRHGAHTVDVRTYKGTHVRTDTDSTERNNLLDLPDCLTLR